MSTQPTSADKLGYDYYAAIEPDRNRHEIVDGEHYVNPAPSTYHQTVSRRIQFQLYAAIELADRGAAFNAPVDLQLSPHDIVQPDLVVILKARRHIVTPTKIKGVPDLVVEILSPSSVEHDTVRKRRMYERCGVPEYWIVDPTEHTLEQCILGEDGRYASTTVGDSVTLQGLPDVRVDLTQVW